MKTALVLIASAVFLIAGCAGPGILLGDASTESVEGLDASARIEFREDGTLKSVSGRARYTWRAGGELSTRGAAVLGLKKDELAGIGSLVARGYGIPVPPPESAIGADLGSAALEEALFESFLERIESDPELLERLLDRATRPEE